MSFSILIVDDEADVADLFRQGFRHVAEYLTGRILFFPVYSELRGHPAKLA
jgi:hypothetical protein